ncbi:MAG TPA: alpha/beta hydrolase-fold protein [Chitinophagaceae bacterium]|nr:alpha/beta hydrolase-fold protein [Chitinophagaceae bacterium]
MIKFIFCIVVSCWHLHGHTQSDRIVLHSFNSKVFNNTRYLRVLLPPGYYLDKNRNKRYRVLYLNDGQNLFDSSSSVSTNRLEWRVDEIMDSLWRKNAVTEFIIVGIDNIGRRDRGREYLAYEDVFLSPRIPAPEGRKYPDFLTLEVLPFIDSNYRTIAHPSGRGIGGSSYGAIAALYAVIKKPKAFDFLLMESPSLYVDSAHLLRDAELVNDWPARIYIGVGTNELGNPNCKPGDWDNEAVKDVLQLKTILERKGASKQRLKINVAECATHTEIAWAKRFPVAVMFLFAH